jgi:hypothetical protein
MTKTSSAEPWRNNPLYAGMTEEAARRSWQAAQARRKLGVVESFAPSVRVLDPREPVRSARELAAAQFTDTQKPKGNGSATETGEAVSLEDFVAYMPASNAYIFKPTREIWPAANVNAHCPPIQSGDDEIAASKWLAKHAAVAQMTWAPGEPMLIEDRLVSDGGWIRRDGITVFNLYRPPIVDGGNARKAGRWLDHLGKVYPDEAEHIVKWLAHRVQKPHEKINHALVLGGAQGIGKDTLLEPVKYAIGPWNFCEVSPQQMLGRFNGFLKSVILRVSEVRDLGDVDRFAFYDHLKAYTAVPPDVLRVDEKNLREYSVFNVVGLIITSNHKTDGIFLPADDRRHFVAWSNLTKDNFADGYWRGLWGWYANGGSRHVAAYLSELDISAFDAKAPPPKTSAFFAIVDADRAPEDAELADVLDALGWPPIVTISQIAARAAPGFAEWLQDRKNARRVPHRLEAVDYVPVRNPNDTEGRWKINGRRHTIYGRATISERDRLKAAFDFSGAR